jgi:hypothetical protein
MHPDADLDEDAELGKLHGMTAVALLSGAAQAPELAATLLRQLDQHDSADDMTGVVAGFLEANFLQLAAAARDHPSIVEQAVELGRGLAGQSMAERVRHAAVTAEDDEEVDLAAAFVVAMVVLTHDW